MLGIVLTRHDIREADQQISLYTDESGKIEVLARSVKKITSKNSSHLEPYTCVYLETTWGKEKDVLTSVQSVESFSEVRRDLFKHASALFVVRAVDAIYKVGERDTRMFALLHALLTQMRDETAWRLYHLDMFFLQLACLLGFQPFVEVKHQREQYVFSLSEGSILDQESVSANEFFVSEPVRAHIEATLADMAQAPLLHDHRSEFHDFVFTFLRFHLDSVALVDWKNIEKFA